MATQQFEHALWQGRACFQRGEWAAAHSSWEAGAKVTRDDEQALLQALALWASAAAQHGHLRTAEAQRLLIASLEQLSHVRLKFAGLADRLHDAVGASLEAVRRPWSSRSHLWPEEGGGGRAVQPELRTRCPYCGEPVLVVVASEDAGSAQYVEDCPVCCRPWEVSVRDGMVTLGRDDGQ